MSERRTSSLGTGCAVVVAIVCLIIGGLCYMWSRGKAEINPVVEQYESLLDRGEYRQVYATLGQGFKDQTTPEQFAAYSKFDQWVLGNHKTMTLAALNVNSNTNGTFGVATYTCQFEKGEATVKFSLKKENGQWVIYGEHTNSALFQNALTCPNCKKVNSAPGKFCSFCGKPMHLPGFDDTQQAPQTSPGEQEGGERR